MAVVTGPVWVAPPNPVVPRYGLFRAATGPLDLPVHARIGGLQYETTTCDLPDGYEVTRIQDHGTKTMEQAVTTVSGAPFVVYSSFTCSSVGLLNWGDDKVYRFLYDQLVAGEQATVERIFSTSANGQAPGLGGNAAVVDLGSAANVTDAISALQSWLYARYGLPGVIHAPIAAAPYFDNWLINLDGPNVSSGVWRTDVGTAVSFGNYAGTGPTGQVPAANDTWLYITGQVAVWRTPDSELFIPKIDQVLNRSTNELSIVMEREYVITYDCFAAAIQTTLTTGGS